MNPRERFLSIMNFEKPDRNLLWEMGYWRDTLERWYQEGLPCENPVTGELNPGEGIRAEAVPHDEFSTTRSRDSDVHGQLGLDAGLLCLPVNSGPQPPFEREIFEDTEDFLIFQDELGVKKRINKKEASIPEFIGWQVENRGDFEKLTAERFQPALKGRVPANWPELVGKYKNRDYPLTIGGYPYGFYGFLRYLVGEERLLLSFYDNPEMVREMISFFTGFWIELWDQVLSQVEVDCAHFWEDMAYRTGPLISPAMFREFMTPCYQRITAFLKDRGVRIILVDTDGNLDQLIPLFLEAGLTGVYPVEVQAGNDLVAIRKSFPKLQLLGGIDKIKIARGPRAIDEELESKLPFLLNSGGYIPYIDHLVHPEISWADFCYYRRRLKEIIEEA